MEQKQEKNWVIARYQSEWRDKPDPESSCARDWTERRRLKQLKRWRQRQEQAAPPQTGNESKTTNKE